MLKIHISWPVLIVERRLFVINPNNFISSVRLSQQQLLNGIAVWLSEGSGWVISSIDEHYINTAVYKPLEGSSTMKTMSVSVGPISAI